MTDDKLKVVIFGAFGAGKSTLIQTLDPHARHIEAECAGGSTTIALDYGRVEVDGRHVYLFGTPRQERFEFAREIIAKGMDGAILLVDATSQIDVFTQHLYDSLTDARIPFAVLLNKCEEVGAQPDALKKHFDGAPVHTIRAKDCRIAFDVLRMFVAALPPGHGHVHHETS